MKSDNLVKSNDKSMKRLERVKRIEPSYSSWKSGNLLVLSAAVLTFSVFWPVEIITEFLVVRMASPMLAVKALGELLLN